MKLEMNQKFEFTFLGFFKDHFKICSLIFHKVIHQNQGSTRLKIRKMKFRIISTELYQNYWNQPKASSFISILFPVTEENC